MLGFRLIGKLRPHIPTMPRVKPGSLFRLGRKDDPNGDALVLVNAVRPKVGWLSGLLRWIFGKKRFIDLTWYASNDPAMPLSKIRAELRQEAAQKGLKRLKPAELEQAVFTRAQETGRLVAYWWERSLKLVEGFFGRAFIRDAEGRKHRIDRLLNFLQQPAPKAG